MFSVVLSEEQLDEKVQVWQGMKIGARMDFRFDAIHTHAKNIKAPRQMFLEQ